MFALMREYISTCFYTAYDEMANDINMILLYIDDDDFRIHLFISKKKRTDY